MSLNLVRAGRYRVTLLEKGPHIAAHIQDHWAHVKLFSSNALNMSLTGQAVITEQAGGDTTLLPDPAAYSSGGDFVDMYLKPLEKFLSESGKCDIRFNTEVVSVGRKDAPKHKQVVNRALQPFVLLCQETNKEEENNEGEYYFEADVGELIEC